MAHLLQSMNIKQNASKVVPHVSLHAIQIISATVCGTNLLNLHRPLCTNIPWEMPLNPLKWHEV